MTDLLKRLETEPPSRELFLDAYKACFECTVFEDQYQSGVLGTRTDKAVRQKSDRFLSLVNCEAWTDAALTLVPEGWFWGVWLGVHGDRKLWGCATAPSIDEADPITGETKASAAQAICIAALKARGVV